MIDENKEEEYNVKKIAMDALKKNKAQLLLKDTGTSVTYGTLHSIKL